MARDDHHFWSDYFGKYPVIAFFTAIGGIAGCVAGCFGFDGRIYPPLIACATAVGGGVGLVIGVLVDTFLEVLRGDGLKKRGCKPKPKDRTHDGD